MTLVFSTVITEMTAILDFVHPNTLGNLFAQILKQILDDSQGHFVKGIHLKCSNFNNYLSLRA